MSNYVKNNSIIFTNQINSITSNFMTILIYQPCKLCNWQLYDNPSNKRLVIYLSQKCVGISQKCVNAG